MKSLLYPTVSVLTLLACLALCGEPFYGRYFLISVLAFFGTAEFLEVAIIQGLSRLSFALRSLTDIALRWFLIVGFIWALLHLSGLTGELNEEVLLIWTVVTAPVLWIGQFGAQYILVHGGKRAAPSRNAVIVGLTELGCRLASTLADDLLLRTKVVGYFDDRSAERLAPLGKQTLLGELATLPDYIAANDISLVYITLPMKRDPRIVNLLAALRDSTVSIYFVPDLFMFNLVQARFDLMHGIPLVAVCETPFFGVRGVAKRLFDLLAAASLTIAISPILLVTAICVRLDSPGPVIFRQKRYGLDGKPITVYKFRSMTVTEDGEKNYTQVSRQDARVTAFGHFIRKTSLDELPQLFNVLEGSMSIVGPRPHAVVVNEQYRRLIPGYMVRHKVKPGITGWAQINGYRGGDDLESMQKRIEFDLEYLRNWSLRLDLLILLRTATLVWKDTRAY